MANNPKLEGSNLIDAIPQTGECPIKCKECFYNGGRFYRTLDEPLLPSLAETEGKIVRVNSGHDSNIRHDRVLAVTSRYKNKFYNTSIACFNFPAPVVFTCNGREPLFVQCSPNVMFVRIRTNTWDLETQDALVDYYRAHGKPVVVTFMRYYNSFNIINPDDYEWRKNVLNEYYCIKADSLLKIMKRYKGKGVKMCGTPWSSACVDCRNCEFLYWECLRRMKTENPTKEKK